MAGTKDETRVFWCPHTGCADADPTTETPIPFDRLVTFLLPPELELRKPLTHPSANPRETLPLNGVPGAAIFTGTIVDRI